MDNLKPSVDGSEADNDRVADNDSYEHTYRVIGGVLHTVTRKRTGQKHRNEEEPEAVDVGDDSGAVDGSDVVGASKTKRVRVYNVNEYGLAFDEIREEELHNETDDDRIQHRRPEVCNKCRWRRHSSMCMCIVCDKYPCLCIVCEEYICMKCLYAHDYKYGHHIIINIWSESETDMQVGKWVDTLMDEKNGEEEFNRENVSKVDKVLVKHELDEANCYITGICSLDYLTWVSCDYRNKCIKLFSVGPNLLQRYIRFRSSPWNVTEIKTQPISNDEHTESIAKTSDSLSEPSTKLKRQCLLAVSFPQKQCIMFIDLSKRPPVQSKIIKTDTPCYSIGCHNNRLYVSCGDEYATSFWSVDVMSLDGEVLHTIQTTLLPLISSHIAVGKDSIFITDYSGNRVVCLDHEGQYKSNIAMEVPCARGISLDSENDRLYVVGGREGTVIYRLNTDLTNCEEVLDFHEFVFEDYSNVFFHKDKLYIGETNYAIGHITVVRVL